MKNSLRRIFALALVVMMIASLGMSAMADTPTKIDSINFNKTVNKDLNAYAPDTTYSFEIKAYTPEENETPNGTEAAPFVGPDGGATAADVASTPDDLVAGEGDVKDIGQASRVYTGTITFDHSKFTEPGVYRYTVKENAGSYAGMTYDNTTKYLDVYVAESGDATMVFGAVMYDMNGTANDEAKAAGFTNTLATTTLTINKKVNGNLGDTNKLFTFTVTVTGQTENELFYAVKNEDTATPIIINSGVGATVQMAHNDTLVVYGLSAGDKYTVTEDAQEYTATISKKGTEGTVSAAASAETGIGADAVEYTFTNTKDVTVPTGIAMTILPFVAMILIAAVVAVLFFKKRERREA